MPEHQRTRRKTRDRELNRDALEALLRRLDPDREVAAERYQEIHSRLTRLYEWRHCSSPEELADEALDRVARKLRDGLEIRSPERYVTRVASLVFREIVRREQRRRLAVEDEMRHPAPIESDGEDDHRSRCFHRCLDRIEAQDKARLLRYYEGDRGAKIVNRRRLASELGVAPGTLRVRMLRARQGLQACVDDCLHEQGA